MIEAYLIHILILVCIYIILSLSLQLSMGYTGILNLGHVAFFAIGAYASALITLAGYPFWLGLLAAGLFALLSGFLLSRPINKLKGDYLALATLGFSFVVYAIALNWTEVTRGPLGLPGIPKPELFGLAFSDNLSFLGLALVICAISYLVIRRIVGSPFGKVLEAIRDDELAAKVLGKNTSKMKAYSLAVSAFFAGIAGSLYAHYITYIDPSSFTIMQLIPLLAIAIIGGLASLRGTIAATILLIAIPEALRFIDLPSSIVGPGRQAIYAVLLLLILIYRPKGLDGKVELT